MSKIIVDKEVQMTDKKGSKTVQVSLKYKGRGLQIYLLLCYDWGRG
jgi:hypothetical protein